MCLGPESLTSGVDPDKNKQIVEVFLTLFGTTLWDFDVLFCFYIFINFSVTHRS